MNFFPCNKVNGGTGASGEVIIASDADYEIDTGLDDIKFFHISSFNATSEWYISATTEFDQPWNSPFPSDTSQIVVGTYAIGASVVYPAPIPCNSDPGSPYGGSAYAPWIKSINGGKVTVHAVWGRTYQWYAN